MEGGREGKETQSQGQKGGGTAWLKTGDKFKKPYRWEGGRGSHTLQGREHQGQAEAQK